MKAQICKKFVPEKDKSAQKNEFIRLMKIIIEKNIRGVDTKEIPEIKILNDFIAKESYSR
jgi:hypothetical protein